MQKVFELSNKYLILATPLILYTLFSSIYLVVSASGGKILNLIFAMLLFVLMTSAFFAGWLNMVKYAIADYYNENPNLLIKEFMSGVGEYFIPTLNAIIIMLIIFSLTFVFALFIGKNVIGNLGVPAGTISNAMQNTATMIEFLKTLNQEQLIKINLWQFLLMGVMLINYFIDLLYLPALFLKNKNPIKAFIYSLKDLFSKKIFYTTGIFLLILLINFIISFLSVLFGANSIMHFVITLFNFYFVIVAVIGVFYYYDLNFVKPQIGQNVDLKI